MQGEGWLYVSPCVMPEKGAAMERRRNYARELDALTLTFGERVPRLLLHACCAPCSSACLEYLSRFFSVTVLFYNPNIAPEEEFAKRAQELERLVRELPAQNPVRAVIDRFDPQEFYAAVRGIEATGEGGARCEACFRLRLGRAAQYAKKNAFDYFCTTLTISPLKNAQLLNRVGEELSELYGVPFLPSDFKKKGGYARSVELSREYGLYRQNYCGCVFSQREAQQREQARAYSQDTPAPK